MWRSLMRTTPAGTETWKPALRPTPTTNSVEPPPMSITTVGSLAAGCGRHGAEERELGLFLAGEHPRVEAVVVAHARGEVGAVGGVADGGGEDGDVGLAVVRVDRRAVVGERRRSALDRLLGERAAGVDAVAEARDVGLAQQLLDGAAVRRVDVGDQQAGGVRADVDDGDAHGRGS